MLKDIIESICEFFIGFYVVVALLFFAVYNKLTGKDNDM